MVVATPSISMRTVGVDRASRLTVFFRQTRSMRVAADLANYEHRVCFESQVTRTSRIAIASDEGASAWATSSRLR